MFLIQGVVLTPVGGHPQFQEVLLGLHVNLEHPLGAVALLKNLVTHRALEPRFAQYSNVFQVLLAFQMATPVVKQD